jgi:hypothetical protein
VTSPPAATPVSTSESRRSTSASLTASERRSTAATVPSCAARSLPPPDRRERRRMRRAPPRPRGMRCRGSDSTAFEPEDDQSLDFAAPPRLAMIGVHGDARGDPAVLAQHVAHLVLDVLERTRMTLEQCSELVAVALVRPCERVHVPAVVLGEECAERVGVAARPRVVVVADELPRLCMSPCRTETAAAAAATAAPNVRIPGFIRPARRAPAAGRAPSVRRTLLRGRRELHVRVRRLRRSSRQRTRP